MYVIQNAIKNLGRNKGRNIMVFVIVFAIIAATAVSIIIRTTSEEIIENYATRFGSEVTIKLDYMKVYQDNIEYKKPSASMLFDFADSDYLLNSEFDASLRIYPENFKMVGPSMSMGGSLSASGNSNGGVLSGGGDPNANQISAGTIYAPSRDDINDAFKNGSCAIIDGIKYKNNNECIISNVLADKNDLKVGDTISIYGSEEKNRKKIELKVVGIYKNFDYAEGEEEMPSPMNSANNIYVNSDTLFGMEGFENNGEVSSKYFLKNPDMLNGFEKEVRGKGLDSAYEVTTDTQTYETIVAPVKGLTKVAGTFLIVILVLGGVVLIFLSTLAIRERKYEVGVLRAMGMKKGKLAFGLSCEMLMITVVGLALGLAAGYFLSQPVADILLASQLSAPSGSPIMATPIGQEPIEALSEIVISLSGTAIVQISMIALALALVSSLVSILYITKYEPMKILSERN